MPARRSSAIRGRSTTPRRTAAKPSRTTARPLAPTSGSATVASAAPPWRETTEPTTSSAGGQTVVLTTSAPSGAGVPHRGGAGANSAEPVDQETSRHGEKDVDRPTGKT